MVGEHSDLRRDYFVITKLCGGSKSRWTWEIKGRSKPLGVKFEGDEFTTEKNAKLAGEMALKKFLDGLGQI